MLCICCVASHIVSFSYVCNFFLFSDRKTQASTPMKNKDGANSSAQRILDGELYLTVIEAKICIWENGATHFFSKSCVQIWLQYLHFHST